MSDHNLDHNPHYHQERLESYQEKVVEQYAELFEQAVFQTADQALSDQLANAESLAIRRAFHRFKVHSQNLLQGRLNELNRMNSQKILQLRAELPNVSELDTTPELELPSLQEGIDTEMNHYAVLAAGEATETIADDLSEALDA